MLLGVVHVRTNYFKKALELALRLEEALGVSAEFWLAMQSAYDLNQAKKSHRVKITRIDEEATA
jgi:addiction module HigA family antidote